MINLSEEGSIGSLVRYLITLKNKTDKISAHEADEVGCLQKVLTSDNFLPVIKNHQK